jgi:phospholipase/carboxylesterase
MLDNQYFLNRFVTSDMENKFFLLILLALSLVFQIKCGSKKTSETNIKLEPDVPIHYEYRIPEDYNSAEPPALVIALHGHDDSEAQPLAVWDDHVYFEPDFILLAIRGPFKAQHEYAWVVESDTNLKGARERRKASTRVSEKRIFDVLEEFKKKYKFEEKLIYLIGYSQGSMIALHVGLKNPDVFAGIAGESGAYDTLLLPVKDLKDIEGMDIYLAAGREERLTQAMRNTEALLTKAGANVMLYIHEGGHIITVSSTRKMQNFFELSLEKAPEDDTIMTSSESYYSDEEEIPENATEDESDYQDK